MYESDIAALADRYASDIGNPISAKPEPSLTDRQIKHMLALETALSKLIDKVAPGLLLDGDILAEAEEALRIADAKPEPVNQQTLARCIEQVDACMDVTQVEPEDSAAWLVVKAAAEAAQPVGQQAEPVAWMISDNDDPELGVWLSEQKGNFPGCNNVPLYAYQQPASAQPVAVPEGYVLVPKKVTVPMACAWKDAMDAKVGILGVWDAMLSAAQQQEGV